MFVEERQYKKIITFDFRKIEKDKSQGAKTNDLK